MVKLLPLLRKPLPPGTCLSTIAGSFGVVSGVLIFYLTDSVVSWDLWIPFGLIVIAIVLLLLELRKHHQSVPDRYETSQILVLIGVIVAVSATWLPGIVRERTFFNELKPKSIRESELVGAIERAAHREDKETEAQKKLQLENLDRLLRFPTLRTETNTLIEYGYTTFSERVAETPRPRVALVIALSIGAALVFVRIGMLPLKGKARLAQFALMAFALFLIGGLAAYPLSGYKTGILVLVGFYTGLFTWVFGLSIDTPKEKFGIGGNCARSAEQADAVYRYYMRLLAFALGVLGIVIIGLVFHVSQMTSVMYAFSPSLRHHSFVMMILHDFYGSTVLFVGVVCRLQRILADIVDLFPSAPSKPAYDTHLEGNSVHGSELP